MNKRFKLVVALLLAIFTLPVFGNAVFAESTDFEDGEHEINYIILKSDSNDISSAAKSFVKPAKLIVEQGTKIVQIGFKGSSMITELEMQEVDFEVTRNTEENIGVLEIELLDGELTDTLFMDMVIDTSLFGGPGIMPHKDVRLFLNVDSIEDIPEEQLEASIKNEEQSEDENNEEITTDTEYYTIDFAALHAEEEKPSTMAGFMAKTAFVSEQDGKVAVTIGVADQTVTKLQLNGQDSVASEVKNATRFETFEFESLPASAEGYVEYQAPFGGDIHYGKADFRMVFDESTVEEADLEDQYANEYVPAPRPTPGQGEESKEETTEESKENTETTEDDKNVEKETEEVVKEEETKVDPFAPDKVYEINYSVKHATEDETSAADQFFVKPAKLLVKDGVNYIQLTVTNSDMIDSLTTENGDVVVVQKNADGSMVVQFKVDGNLADAITMDMHITVPNMYSMEHSARLFLDLDSQKEIATNDVKVAESANNNGITVNPKTGEDTNLLLYVFLLIGSAVPLFMIARKRLAQ
ncbi:NEAT domain-containing protein [Ornithinibacillus halophilus]|uniref:Iron Transport-associated domain-containing protein n=1 Tax=Ornithinibacillus halophilus TaxID=930117 RepID=A0A1M5KFM1_9BACI|nr:NEAT domain-containing protein [Ornithinibacillus halophilus]SHG51646.1 Iron Transport-associated domain-containing protein [Ornithinibacillus halophilus]